MNKIENVLEDVTIMLGIIIDEQDINDEILKDFKNYLNVEDNFEDFKEDFSGNSYSDDFIEYITKFYDINVCYDFFESAYCIGYDIGDASLETKTIKELKEDLLKIYKNLELDVNYNDVEFYSVEG